MQHAGSGTARRKGSSTTPSTSGSQHLNTPLLIHNKVACNIQFTDYTVLPGFRILDCLSSGHPNQDFWSFYSHILHVLPMDDYSPLTVTWYNPGCRFALFITGPNRFLLFLWKTCPCNGHLGCWMHRPRAGDWPGYYEFPLVFFVVSPPPFTAIQRSPAFPSRPKPHSRDARCRLRATRVPHPQACAMGATHPGKLGRYPNHHHPVARHEGATERDGIVTRSGWKGVQTREPWKTIGGREEAQETEGKKGRRKKLGGTERRTTLYLPYLPT